MENVFAPLPVSETVPLFTIPFLNSNVAAVVEFSEPVPEMVGVPVKSFKPDAPVKETVPSIVDVVETVNAPVLLLVMVIPFGTERLLSVIAPPPETVWLLVVKLMAPVPVSDTAAPAAIPPLNSQVELFAEEIVPVPFVTSPMKMFEPALLLSVITAVPLRVVVPETVKLKPARFKERVVLITKLFTVASTLSTIAELIMTSSPDAGTPAGDQLPPVFHVVPVDVLVTPYAWLPANSKKLKNSKVGIENRQKDLSNGIRFFIVLIGCSDS